MCHVIQSQMYQEGKLISECFPHTLEILHLPMRITDFRTALRPVYLIQESMSRMIYNEETIDQITNNGEMAENKTGLPLMLFRISLWFS